MTLLRIETRSELLRTIRFWHGPLRTATCCRHFYMDMIGKQSSADEQMMIETTAVLKSAEPCEQCGVVRSARVRQSGAMRGVRSPGDLYRAVVDLQRVRDACGVLGICIARLWTTSVLGREAVRARGAARRRCVRRLRHTIRLRIHLGSMKRLSRCVDKETFVIRYDQIR